MNEHQTSRPKRMVLAEDVLSGRWSSRQYPFRYIVVWHGKEIVARARNRMYDSVLSAVEFLENEGWELVNVDEAVSIALMRRNLPSAPHR